jgi:signal transduction histidine kinase
LRRVSSKVYLMAIIAFLFLLDGLALWFAISFDHDRTVERTKIILQKTAISLDERVKRTYTASEAILRNLAYRIEEKGIGPIVSSRAEWVRFRSVAETLPDKGTLWLLDSKADLRMDSTQYPSRPMSFADREYYVPQRDRRVETYVGPVVKGRITHKYSFTISRRITGRDGHFLGIVVAAMEADDFTNFLRNLDIGEGSHVTVFRMDGALILRQPMQDQLLGKNFNNLALFRMPLDKAPSGVFESTQLDGTRLLIAYRKIEGLPLLVTTGIPLESVLKAWRIRAGYYVLMAVAGFLILAGFSWRVHKSTAREELALRELVRAGEEISRANEELELRVRQRTAALEASNREHEAFTYTVSHDLRAPLRAIDGFSGILQKQYGERLDAEGQRLLDVIRKNTRDMGNLIDDLLAFARLDRQQVNPAEVDMTGLARAVYAELKSAVPERDVTFVMKDLPAARSDRALIRLVFANLLSNALKFTRRRADAVIEVGGSAEGNESIYWVKDNGIGFDMRYADKLFGIFERLHDADEFEGTGVGLAIVQRIVLKHGGRVWGEGKVNEGATVYFSLPRSLS